MKKLILTVLFLITMASMSFAGTATLDWKSVGKADGYKVYISFDLGATWDKGIDVGSVVTYKFDNLPESGLVLFRVGAYNRNGETIRYEFGTWYNGDWKPIEAVSGTGISSE